MSGRSFGAAALALLAALVVAAPASASYDLIGSGTAKLTLDGSFNSVLKKNGIKFSGRSSAKVKGKVATLKAAGGKADPTIKKAEIDLAGELVLAKGKKDVGFRQITLKTKPTPIFAKVGGGQLKLVKAGKVVLERDGFGNELVATKLKLTKKVATRLNKRLDVEAFSQGQLVGSLKSAVQPKTIAILQGGLVTLTLDPTIVAKLTALSVAINPVFPAEHQGPVFTLPIDQAGALAPDGKSGTLRTQGSIEFLRIGAGQLFWKETWLDFGTSTASSEEDLEPAPPYSGKLGRVPFLDMTVPSFSTDPSARTMSVSGATLKLQAATADFFNKGFAEGKEEFHAGETLGSFSFVAQSQ